jgi:type I restriction enzyme S subunit
MTTALHDWADVTLSDFGEIVAGGTPSRAVPSFWNGEIPWATPSEITALKGRYLHETREQITLEGLEASAARVLPPGTLLVTSRATLGEVAIAAVSMTTNQGFKNIIPNERTDPLFAYYRVKTLKREMERFASGTTFLEISKADFSRIRAVRPQLAEQSRIGAVLAAADAAIAQTEAIIAKLRQVRTGLLRNLLSCGINEHAQIRSSPADAPHLYQDSPVGKIPKGWRLGNISTIAVNRDARRVPLKQADRDTRHGIYPYYGASGIIDFIDDYLFDGNFVLIGEDGENLRSRQLPLAFIATGKFWVNNHAHILEPMPDTDVRFLAILLEAQDYIPWLLGSAQPKLTQRNLEQVPLRIPTPREQSMISDRLAALDTELESEIANVEKLRHIKSGLTADLLSGRVRVPETLLAEASS